jgi:hypothetical protein
VASSPSYLPLHACTPKGCLLWLTTQQPKRKEEEKKEEREKEAELMNSGLYLFLNLGLTSTQVGSMVKILPKIQFKLFINITNIRF